MWAPVSKPPGIGPPAKSVKPPRCLGYAICNTTTFFILNLEIISYRDLLPDWISDDEPRLQRTGYIGRIQRERTECDQYEKKQCDIFHALKYISKGYRGTYQFLKHGRRSATGIEVHWQF
jgi:hypothetical protein